MEKHVSFDYNRNSVRRMTGALKLLVVVVDALVRTIDKASEDSDLDAISLMTYSTTSKVLLTGHCNSTRTGRVR